ncbi:MAG: carbohydrate kinase family protein [Candidatus Woesebacteria bacterium]|jgi:adenosine kinase
MKKLLLIGSIAIDRIMVFDGLFEDLIQPDKLHVLSVVPLVDKMRETRGGTAANIAYSLALLGEEAILYASAGRNAKTHLRRLKKIGINTTYVRYSRLATASFTVLTDKNDCQVGGFYPGAMSDADNLTIERFFKNWVKETQKSRENKTKHSAEFGVAVKDKGTEHFSDEKLLDIGLASSRKSSQLKSDFLVVLSPHDPQSMLKQVKECQSLNLPLFFDPGQQVLMFSGDDLKIAIKAADFLVANDYEMGMISKKTGWSLEKIARQLKIMIVTLGGKGSEVYENRQVKKSGDKTAKKKSSQGRIKKIIVPAVKLEQTVDPTGAGDAYRAGFLYGYIRDWHLRDCARLGSVVSSFVLEKHGTQEHSFTKKAVAKRFKDSYGVSCRLMF